MDGTARPKVVLWRGEPLWAQWLSGGRVRLKIARDWDEGAFFTTADHVTPAADIEGLDDGPEAVQARGDRLRDLKRPRPAAVAPAAREVECLECGATYPAEKAHLVDAGGMGCVRCNH
jgi:hypothetical protein